MNYGGAISSAIVAFVISLVILFLISALVPNVNVAVMFWSLVVAAIVFLLTLFGTNRL